MSHPNRTLTGLHKQIGTVTPGVAAVVLAVTQGAVTYREIMAATGYRSLETITRHVDHATAEGLIKRGDRRQRRTVNPALRIVATYPESRLEP